MSATKTPASATASTPPPAPRRGEVWRVQLEPIRGSEQGKTRPVVVLSEPSTGRARMRICAPIIHAKPEHGGFYWCVALMPDAANGLSKDSSANAAQVRALDVVRFEVQLGALPPDDVELVAAALCHCVKQPPAPPQPSAAATP